MSLAVLNYLTWSTKTHLKFLITAQTSIEYFFFVVIGVPADGQAPLGASNIGDQI